jgi:disulfide bond formation protein DsbB
MIRFMKQPTPKCLLLGAVIASAVMLTAAFAAQYGFGLYPCELCMAQRYPYAAIIVLGLIGCLVKSPRSRYGIAMLCALLFLIDSGIAFYHTGVELGWFPTPSACSNPASTGHETLEEMRAQIMSAPLVTCNQAMAHIFGLSLAAWNGIGALAFALGMACGLRKIRHA